MSGIMAPRGRKQRDWKRVFIVVVVVAILATVGAVLYVRREYNANLRPASGSQKVFLFTVNKGASVKEVAADLHEQGLIRAAWAFEWYFRNHNLMQYLQAGTYNVRP